MCIFSFAYVIYIWHVLQWLICTKLIVFFFFDLLVGLFLIICFVLNYVFFRICCCNAYVLFCVSLYFVSILLKCWVVFFLACFNIFFYVSGSTALRVHPAVTRLTVYRRLYVSGDSERQVPNFSKSVISFGPTMYLSLFFRMWLSIRGVISPNKCVTPELGTNKLRCHGTENFENRKFHEILTLVTFVGVTFNDFCRWRKFHCNATREVLYYMTRGALCL